MRVPKTPPLTVLLRGGKACGVSETVQQERSVGSQAGAGWPWAKSANQQFQACV